jgi:PhoPQ-activated pathogenicity-related protein
MNHRLICVALLLAAFIAAPLRAQSLRPYVEQPDDSFSYTIEAREKFGPHDLLTVRMTSQTWQGKPWQHWVSILVPENVTASDRAILLITGGSTRAQRPKHDRDDTRIFANLTASLGAVFVVLEQVPNQPLYDNLKEDALIAYSFDKYLRGEGNDWPLLGPMVKSAVRAMDATQAIVADERDVHINEFIVTGASKRGWTTYLTGALDDRVCAIAPMVIDMLNLAEQMPHQWRSYGAYSRMIHDYVELNVIERMNRPQGEMLRAMVDPLYYRDAMTMPKLVLLGSNDPYWTADAASLYFDQLPQPRWLYSLANAGHGLGAGSIPTLHAFFEANLTGKSLPALDWERDDDGTLTVDWQADGKLTVDWQADGGAAQLWTATSDSRDFRESKWISKPLDGRTAKVQPPDEGYIAYFIEVRFNRDGQGISALPFGLTTTTYVLPDVFEHELPER